MTWGPMMIYEKRWACKLGFHNWIFATTWYKGQMIQVCEHCRVTKAA